MFAKLAAAKAPSARRLSVAAVVATAVLGLSACGTQIAAAPAAAVVTRPLSLLQQTQSKSVGYKVGTGKRAATALTYTAGMSLISNGTSTVGVGGQSVTFPTTVTDAAWSPDGARVAFIDANGNVATANPNGTGLTELTTAKAGVTRSDPAWFGHLVLFTEKDAKGVTRLESVTLSGGAAQTELLVFSGYPSADGTYSDDGNSFPSAAADLAPEFDKNGLMAFQHQGAEGPEVWIVDYNSRESVAWMLAEGSDPAVSPDGNEVAFVDGKGQVEVIDTDAGTAATPTQITFSAADPTDLAWSPDGSRVAYSTVSGIQSVASKLSGSTTSNPPTQLSSSPGTVTFLPGYKAVVDQFTGTDPVALSIAASQDRYPTESQYEMDQDAAPATYATIGSSTNLSEDLLMLRTVPGDGPLLLTGGSSLDPRVSAELQRVFGKLIPGQDVPTVYLLGGTSVISTTVETAIQQLGYHTIRVTSSAVNVPPAPPSSPYTAVRTPLIRTVLVDSASQLDEVVGIAYAWYYDVPVMDVSSSGLTAANQSRLAESGGAQNAVVLFGSAAGFGTSFASSVAAAQGDPLGYTLVINPESPIQF